jgi:predicted RNA polymerase sigma factor
MVLGPRAGLDLLATIDSDSRIANHHLLYAVRGHLLEMAGHTEEAANSFESAARRTASAPEKRYLTARSLGLRAGSDLARCRRR